MKLLAAASFILLAAPGVARAELASITSRELPLVAPARSPAAQAPRFNLVGLHWRGPGSVRFRTRALDGRWTAWRPAAPEDEDGPDARSGESSRPGWTLGNPYWVGASDRIEYRTRGAVSRLRGYFVWSPVGQQPVRRPAVTQAPLIVPRSSWGANELIKRGAPRYADNLSFAVVHHTAGANAYTREESAAIVRAIQLYHVQGNGWNDIGYNFLVDKYGQVFEGRFGGAERNVVGAHAEGFNTGSTGVAVLGTYGATSISPAARDAVVRLLAWRLDVAHVDPLTTLTFPSGGNARFPAGRPVPLRAIVGHRDTGFTSCPGDALYRQLDGFAASVAAAGGPKLFEPLVRGRLGTPVRFTGRLSAALPWTVTVADRLGTQVAAGAGTGTAIDWTWDATLVPQLAYTWTIAAGPTVRPATGTIGTGSGQLAPTIAITTVTPTTFTPNGDGYEDATTVVYTLGAAATVTATVSGPDGGVLTIFAGARAAGEQRFAWAADSLPDGAYRISLTAATATAAATAFADVVVTRTLSSLQTPRATFSPNGDGRVDRFPISFALAAPAEVKLRILRDGKWVATPFAGPLQPGAQRLEWDGSKRIGRALSGAYELELTVVDAVGTVTRRQPLAVDNAPPTLGLITRRPLRVRISEPGELVVRAGGRRVVVKATRAGLVRLPVELPASVQAWDLAGNVAKTVRYARSAV